MENYHDLSDQLPLFLRPAFLDAVYGPDRWALALARDGEGRIRGLWPYAIRRRWGMAVLQPPPLTPWLGPWLLEAREPLRATRRVEWEWRLYSELLTQIPPCSYASFKAPPSLHNGMPFQAAGWRQQVRYRYVLQELDDTQRLWTGLRAEVRNKVRKAEAGLTVATASDTAALWPLVAANFRRQGSHTGFDAAWLTGLADTLRREEWGDLWLATDPAGRVHAALLLAWDDTTAYNLVLGSDPTLRQSGAPALLLWRAIAWATSQNLPAFDFCGSQLPGVESFYRGFGGSPQPYYWFTRSPRWLSALLAWRG